MTGEQSTADLQSRRLDAYRTLEALYVRAGAAVDAEWHTAVSAYVLAVEATHQAAVRAGEREQADASLRAALLTIQREVALGKMAYHSGGDLGMVFDADDAAVEHSRRGHWTFDDRAMERIEAIARAALAGTPPATSEELA